jgi:soluble lytic murein transglycosylase
MRLRVFLVLVFFLVFIPAVNSVSVPEGSPTASLPLPEQILETYSAGRYLETTKLLEQFRQRDPEAFKSLPYEFLYAKALVQSGQSERALHAYRVLATIPDLNRSVSLSTARLAASLNSTDEALRFYSLALQDRTHPDYATLARESLEYAWINKNSEALKKICSQVGTSSGLGRLTQFYSARVYLLGNNPASARGSLLNLISAKKEDDVTSLALTELDGLDGGNLTKEQAILRGKLAYRVWNFELARKYLKPYSNENISNAYLYARSLAFLGDTQTSGKLLQAAASTWPSDPMARIAMYQYGNLSLRTGDYKKAGEIFANLRNNSAQAMDDSTEKLVHALRAQSRIAEAIKVVNPYCSSKVKKNRQKAILLRAKIYFQGGHYKEAYTDFDTLIKSSVVASKENLFWKALTLEKMNQIDEAADLFERIAIGNDFFSLLAADKYNQLRRRDPFVSIPSTPEFKLGSLPDVTKREQVRELYAKGDAVPALLYLRLYDEAATFLPQISDETWKLLEVDPADRRQRFLMLAYLSGLGQNFGTATYYSELFVKSLSNLNALYSSPEGVLRALFPMPYHEPIRRFSNQRNLDPFLVLSIMRQESKFKRFARSPAFARGLMQIIPSTATRLASDVGLKEFSLDHLYSPEVNINLGTRYIQDLSGRFGKRVEVIAAGYNSGESNVQRWLDCTSTDETFEFFSNIDLPETRTYVMIVRTNYEAYKRTYPSQAATVTASK